MCLAICYAIQSQIFITHFTDKAAKMPLVCQQNSDHYLPWGRRLDEPGELPLGGIIALEKKAKGIYDRFFPKPVKVQAQKFLEQDIEGKCQWFEITGGQYLQGLLLKDRQEQRIYIETFTPNKVTSPFQRWPLIISDDQMAK